MINAVKPVGYQKQDLQFKGEKIETKTQEKNKISDGQKVLIGLGAFAAIVAGGLLVKKHIDIKAAEKAAQELTAKIQKDVKLLQKPEEFTRGFLENEIEQLSKAGKLKDGDELLCFNKTIIDEIIEADKGYQGRLLKEMNMSDNGIVTIIQRANGDLDYSTIKYFDPKKINYQEMSDTFEKGKKIFKIRITNNSTTTSTSDVDDLLRNICLN